MLSFVLKLYEVLTVLNGSNITSLFNKLIDIVFVDGVVSYNIKLPVMLASPAISTFVLFKTKILYVLISFIVKI